MKSEVRSIEKDDCFISYASLTRRDAERMHQDRLDQFFHGLKMIQTAVAHFDAPTAMGEARREFELQVRQHADR